MNKKCKWEMHLLLTSSGVKFQYQCWDDYGIIAATKEISYSYLKDIFEKMKKVKEHNMNGAPISRNWWIERKGKMLYLVPVSYYIYRRDSIIPPPKISFSVIKENIRKADLKIKSGEVKRTKQSLSNVNKMISDILERFD